jgi:hypothetical protein
MDFVDALSRAREHNAIVQRMELAMRAEPSNERLALGIGSARRRAQRSEEDLERFASASQIDIIRYRLEQASDVYAIESVADSVRAFQKSFTGVADFLENGPKEKARYSHEIEDRTRLNFGYSFAGSLGIVMAVENSRDLFGEGELDGIVDVFDQFLSIDDEDEAIVASRTMGGGLTTQLCNWINVNAKWGNAVDFVVKQPSGIQRGQFVPKNRFIDLSDIFASATDVEPHTISVSGILVGLDIKLRKFHFVEPDGEAYKGDLSETFASGPKMVGMRYNAVIQENVIRKVATGKEERHMHLVSLVTESEASPDKVG